MIQSDGLSVVHAGEGTVIFCPVVAFTKKKWHLPK
jgi:hypothetical protein